MSSVVEMERKLAHVLDADMRRALVVEWLTALGGERAARAVGDVVGGLETTPILQPIVCALLSGRGDAGLSYEVTSDLYAAATAADDEDVTRLLRSIPAREVAEDPARLLSREIAEIPLGRRRSLAKGSPSASLLEQLARDPDPVVVRHLLQNPRTTEADVLRMAALRPVAATTLDAIAQSRRFSVLPRIRLALARNPYCPTEIALELVATLSLADMREMRNDPDLHPEVQGQVVARLSRGR